MAFRKNEAIDEGFERAVRYLIPKELSSADQRDLRCYLEDLVLRLGPVVERYPSWHPLVCNHDGVHPITTPSRECGYQGLDHTVYFANGFLSCPYQATNGQKILDSVDGFRWKNAHLRYDHVASIEAERVEKSFYADGADPILVYCNWQRTMPIDNTIPKGIAVGLMLDNEVPNWRRSECGETWESMRPYLMGEPCGKRSSMFLDQEAGQAMKKVYETITYSGMFGNLKL